jgi:hypothetical protein
MPILLEALYLPPISYFSLIAPHNDLLIEQYGHYQKASCRNRAYIATAHGTLLLSIPLEKGKHGHQAMRDVRISYNWNWQKLHWESLQTAYRSSPYFEFYEADLYPYYHKKFNFLLDYNLELLQTIFSLMKWKKHIGKTDSYQANSHIDPQQIIDARQFAYCPPYTTAQNNQTMPAAIPYQQVFKDRIGFLPNLSIIDLLFNKGNYAMEYL